MKKIIDKLNPGKHIMMKIWISAASIALSSLLIIGICTQLFLRSFFIDSSIDRTSNNTRETSASFSSVFGHTVSNFVSICSAAEFQNCFRNICTAEQSSYISINNTLQNTFNDLIKYSISIDSAIITSRSGYTYHLSGQSLLKSDTDYLLGAEEADITGITLLPACKSPVKNGKTVIPLAFPLTFLGNSSSPLILSDAKHSDAILYLLINASSLNNYMSIFCPDATEGTLYLSDQSGKLLNYTPGQRNANTAESIELSRLLSEGISDDSSSGILKCPDKYIFYNKLDGFSFYFINVVSSDTMLAALYSIRRFLFFAAGISVLLITLAALFSALYITKPLAKLMSCVKSIENGAYQPVELTSRDDEIGQLGLSLDSMYHTIQNQIQEITIERQEKYNAQIRLFTEQINPHFLYNTLEYINMEVYNHHQENASFMIQSLGDFMRIGLNFGSDFSSVAKEIEHVQAYLNIMNHRFGNRIIFTSDVEDGLMNTRIPKIIFQPLVENSVRHGFLLDGNGSYIDAPSVRIHIYRENDYLHINITDNGVGIDIPKAEKIMTSDSSSNHHVGLNNVYQRLSVYYQGKASMSFSSIPYYKNTVTLLIPMQSKEDHGS